MVYKKLYSTESKRKYAKTGAEYDDTTDRRISQGGGKSPLTNRKTLPYLN
jgi:hypothetical protein